MPRDPGIENMIDHDQKEGRLAGATLGRQGTGAVAPFPVLGFDEVDRDAATLGDIREMPPDRFGFMTEGDNEPPNVGGQQRAHNPLGQGQAEHLHQGFRRVGFRIQP